MKRKNLFWFTGIVLVLIFITYGVYNRQNSSENYDSFAKCLTEKEMKMYGTEWCSHCQNQKALFGSSFEFITYIDCDIEEETCFIEGIKGYPTWKINNESYVGVQQIDKLKELTGC